MFSKIEVNVDNAAELYQWLCRELADDEGQHPIAWNFAKFLLNQQGKPVKRFHPKVTPQEIEAALADLI